MQANININYGFKISDNYKISIHLYIQRSFMFLVVMGHSNIQTYLTIWTLTQKAHVDSVWRLDQRIDLTLVSLR